MGKGSRNRARRDARQAERRRKRSMTRGLMMLGALIIVGGLTYWIWTTAQPHVGSEDWEVIPTQEAVHIETVETYEPYNTDPPTSGAHFGQPMQPAEAGFYEQSIPDENLVHSLEHGYVIIWYDCSSLGDSECVEVKSGIQQVVEATDTYKVLGMPREGMDDPIIATSWGRMFRLDAFDQTKLVAFVENNLENSPEPSGP